MKTKEELIKDITYLEFRIKIELDEFDFDKSDEKTLSDICDVLNKTGTFIHTSNYKDYY